MSFDKLGAKKAGRISDVVIRVRDVSKHYVMFERPEDRFKQMIVPRLERLVGRPPRRYFRDFAALSGISFDVGRGETVGIIGRNGSGKSTLLQIICGTLQPTAGSVEVNGRIAALLELGAGFNPEFTGRENVFLNASILGVPRKEMEWRFDDIARFADIGPFIDQPVKTYSSGMYVRLAFATAINVDPDILVVDEALSVGDEAFQRKCFARIEDIKDKGGTILFVSHGAPTIVQLCTRAMLIDGGEKILEGRPKAVVGQYQRLVNASPEAVSRIRADIVQQNSAEVRAPSVPAPPAMTHSDLFEHRPSNATASTTAAATAGALGAASEANPQIDQSAMAALHGDYFDPGLRSQSTVALEERGARIRDFKITTIGGDEINVLQMGRRYKYEYTVDFSTNARNVGFGIWFRTVSGIGLGGAQTIFSRSLLTRSIKTNTTARISYEFTNIFLPGVYFISCGLFGSPGDEQIVMHRLVDVTAFRVAAEPDLLATGIIDVSPQISINFEAAE
ncbi:ABC transporter ATP-binding protein [Mesorhizobium sp. M0924]|uniref:ABC transporter ATP-binding protein n=1 Tax=unclassified Mesorhizobium TaxID=325217 RepID=UPI00333CDEEA